MPVNKDYYMLAGSSGQSTGYTIDQSIRFYENETAHMARTPGGSDGNRRTWTFSVWAKFTGESTNGYHNIFVAREDANDFFEMAKEVSHTGNNRLAINNQVGGSNSFYFVTTRQFRDPSAWYHIVFVADTTNAVLDQRFRLFVNGERETDFDTETIPSQNYDTHVNRTVEHEIGAYNSGSGYSMDGYFAEINFVEGYAYGPEYFGEFDENGIWIPKKYTEAYGTKGFYITGSNASALGEDFSGNDNDFATSGLATSDQFLDSPTNNFFIMNNLSNRTYRLFDGNLNVDIGSNVTTHHILGSTMGIHPSATGKYYFEIQWTNTNDSGNVDIVGFADLSNGGNFIGNALNSVGAGYGIGYKVGTGNVYAGNGWTTNSFTFAGPVSQNYYGFAYDASTGRLYIYQNGSALNSGDHVATFDKRSTIGPGLSIYNSNKRYNFFNGAQTSLSNDNFNYSPPAGYGPINSLRLGDDYG